MNHGHGDEKPRLITDEIRASIKYIDDDGEREQDDDDLKADDEHFDDDGDHAYDESDVVEADETTFTKFKYTLSRNGES
jgi:hypothetical protein